MILEGRIWQGYYIMRSGISAPLKASSQIMIIFHPGRDSSPVMESVITLTFYFIASRTVRNHRLLLKSFCYGIFVVSALID
jgi:hypothetical protein